MDRKKPDTLEGMVYEIWYAVWGANGDGVASIAKDNREDIREIKDALPQLLTRTEHVEYHVACEDRERRKKWRTTDVVIAGGMLLLAAVNVVERLF